MNLNKLSCVLYELAFSNPIDMPIPLLPEEEHAANMLIKKLKNEIDKN